MRHSKAMNPILLLLGVLLLISVGEGSAQNDLLSVKSLAELGTKSKPSDS